MTANTLLVFVHLLVIALGIGFSASNFINTRLSIGQGSDVGKGLAYHRRTIARFGDGVIALIWITGLMLFAQRGWQVSSGAFHAKLAFVIVLTLLHGYARHLGERMRREGKMDKLPRLSFAIGGVAASAILALLCAEIAFRG
jgi:uncharacterized membrane protein